jgi:hypothetical protein
MRRKLPVIAAVAAVAVAAPATALSASKSHKPSKSHKCTAHKVAYIAQGTYVSSSPSLTPSKSWSGTLMIKLKSANHHFAKANGLTVKKKGVKGTDYTFTITGAKVTFGKGVKSPATTRDHITVRGTVTEFSGKCTSTTPTITIKTITVSK